jgi:hypothetical protein
MMRGRVLWIELALLLTALAFAEMGEVLRELQSSVIVDWFVSLAPLIWIDVCVLFFYAFLRLFRNPDLLSPRLSATGQSRGWRHLVPNMGALRHVAGDRSFRRTWATIGIAYAVGYSLLQGIIVVDPSGSINPVSTVLESPIGYGPGFVWAPTTTFGIEIRPYFVAAAFTLSFFSGLVIAMSVHPLAARRRAAALPAPLLGFAVMCPACAAAPVTGLFLAYAAPFAAMGGMGAANFSRMLLISTGLLVVTLALLWFVISLLSRIWLAGPIASDSQTSS